MKGLTTPLLAQACRIFLELAYPEGHHTIPPPQKVFAALHPDRALADVLVPPLCQPLHARNGYALRLGGSLHPHLKLQIVSHEDDACVFSVDTHDAIGLCIAEADAPRWTRFQESNRRLKERIERAWEEAGLLTFNALLRRELARP
jgi:hypothetical protein